MPTEIFGTVKSLIEEELCLYKSLAELVDTEEEKVDTSDMEGLLRVLEEKQSIISRQEVLLERWNEISFSLGIEDGREGPVFWNALSSRIGESGYNQVVKHIDEIRELGQGLLDRESQIRGKLEEHLSDMRKTLLSMGRNRVAMKGYSQGMASTIY
ncbi:MAG: flagellar protein FlgN [Synergistaceae bacterium]|nr:flagellar protein FlgN [Synergistaceae bacterium]